MTVIISAEITFDVENGIVRHGQTPSSLISIGCDPFRSSRDLWPDCDLIGELNTGDLDLSKS